MKRTVVQPSIRIPPGFPPLTRRYDWVTAGENRSFFAAGFSILEILVAVTVLALVTVLTFSIINGVSLAWQQQKARISAYEKARIGFEQLGQRLAQATLNTYWDYDDPERPRRYLRQSELHFVMGGASSLGIAGAVTDAVFFLAPLGFTQDASLHPLVKMLTANGYFVRFSQDPARPSFLDERFPARWRYRLFQTVEPGEALSVYDTDPAATAWYVKAVEGNSYPMIDNVIGLILRARYPVGDEWEESFAYDSRIGDPSSPWSHQLPPSVLVTMVVIDEDSARRLEEEHGSDPPPILPPEDSFSNPALYFQDMKDWEEQLTSMNPPVAFRVFEAAIPIRAAKWSVGTL